MTCKLILLLSFSCFLFLYFDSNSKAFVKYLSSVPELILQLVCERPSNNHCPSKQMLPLNYFWNFQQFGHIQQENEKR